MRLTLRTLLAYLDDTLPPAEAGQIGRKLADNPDALKLVDRIRAVTRRRGLATPSADPNATADYLSDALPAEDTADFETAALADDGALAEVAACHQVLTLVLSEQVKVPPRARSRMYALVKGDEAVPNRKPKAALSVATVRDTDPAADADADAQLLLGLPAYSKDSGGKLAAGLGAIAALLLGFAVCLWMAWPADGPSTDRPALVMDSPVPPQPAAPTPATAPAPKPAEPDKPVASTPTPEPENPAAPPPPKNDRVAVGQLEKPATGTVGLLVRPTADGMGWERVGTDPGGVMATDRLVCLPGYKAALKLDSGATIDLWGNLPELVPVPLLATVVTPAVPETGTHADLTVHAGRLYLGSKQPAGVKVRLRFAGQSWEVVLPDDKAEAVFEMIHLATPGVGSPPPASTARLVTLNGPATVTPDGGEAVKLEKSAGLVWTAADGGKPKPLPPLSRVDREPLARVSTLSSAAQPTLTALDALAKRTAEGGSVPALLDELTQAVPDTRAAAPGVVAGNRIGVYGLAALGRGDKLADLLSSPASPLTRQMAAEALGPTLAADPSLAGPVRRVLVEQKKLSPAEADEVFRLLRGLTAGERSDPAALDRLVTDLSSSALPLRELALGTLIGLTPPEERGRVTVPPFVYDVAASEEDREAGQKAWKVRVEGMKKKLTKG